jgi:hypothetical protein
VGRRNVGSEDLPAGHARKRDGDLNSGGAAGSKSLEEAAGHTLSGDSVHPFIPVRTRWPEEQREVREVSACWEALKSNKLKVGEQEYPVAMNTTRGHMVGIEDCSGGWKLQADP